MVETATVTISPPDVTPDSISGGRLNLYLYHISENGYLKNQEIPGQGHPAAYGHPPLCLDLHYLLTAYAQTETSPDADLIAQQILGDAMRVLHDVPIMTEGLEITNPQVGTPGDLLLDTALHGEYEQVKVTFQPLTLEDLSKLWTALPEANFRRSVAYQVSVVQIESRLLRRLAQPVQTRRIHIPLPVRPQVDAVYRTPALPSEPTGDGRVPIGGELTIEGHNMSGTRTWVRLGDMEPIGVTPVSATRIQITVPDDEYPADFDHPGTRPIPEDQQLQPGPTIVEVLTERKTEVVEGGLDKGRVVSDHSVQRSNRAVFMLVPHVDTADLAGGVVTVTGTRLFLEDGNCEALVGDRAVPAAAYTASLPTSISFPHPDLDPGNYLVRVRVDGAESVETPMVTVP
jgi:hypothetical protein